MSEPPFPSLAVKLTLFEPTCLFKGVPDNFPVAESNESHSAELSFRV